MTSLSFRTAVLAAAVAALPLSVAAESTKDYGNKVSAVPHVAIDLSNAQVAITGSQTVHFDNVNSDLGVYWMDVTWTGAGFAVTAYGPANQGVKITTNDAYGHHGACEGWNECGDAQTCAQWACEINGYNSLVSYGRNEPCNSGSFDVCHLFYSQGDIQWNWGNWCGVNGVSDIYCR